MNFKGVFMLGSLLGSLFLNSKVLAQSAPNPAYYVEGALSPTQKSTLGMQFSRAFSLLPPTMRQSLQQDNKSFFKLSVVNLDEHVAGESRKDKNIIINQNILDKPDLLQKTFIHELAHIFDKGFFFSETLKNKLWVCGQWRDNAPPEYCELHKGLSSSVSTLPAFLEITGWHQTLDGRGQRTEASSLGGRSPDRYELQNPLEMFAVNMEHFLTDPEYQCRRPTLHRFFVSYFSYQPFSDKSCARQLAIVDSHFENPDKALKKIDSERIYRIDYLLAGNGTEAVSSFGHSMIRLVICSPNRKAVGPDCLKDIESHIVLSFRGFVDSPKFNALAGLVGDYPSRLFFIPFPQIINEYNVEQLRGLYSYPLALSRKEISQFLDNAIELYWSYQNSYRFLTNNCAIETMNLLKSALLRSNLLNLRPQTPKALLSALELKRVVLSDNKQPISVFEAQTKNLLLGLNAINNLSNQSIELNDWLSSSAQERLQKFKSTKISDKSSRAKWIAGFMILERFIANRQKNEIYRSLLEPAANQSNLIGQQTKEYQESVAKIYEFDQSLTAPAQLIKAGYGIPSEDELQEVRNYLQNLKLKRDANQKKINLLIEKLLLLHGNDEIKRTHDNINLFSQELNLVL